MSALQDRLMFAVDAAKQAGDITLKYFGQLDTGQRHDKADGTPVTIADRESETHLRALIQSRYPDDAILGEEFDPKPGTSGYQWVIDPIDGTISFVHGVPLYGTMLACLRDGHPELGVIHMPVLDEVVYAADGLGCWHRSGVQDAKRAHMSQTLNLAEALINTTSMSYFKTPELRVLYEKLDAMCKHSRGWSDCYAWILLATGRVDAVVEPDLKLWDFAAALPIISESGGIWSDLQGKATLQATRLVASNAALHSQLLDTIKDSLSMDS